MVFLFSAAGFCVFSLVCALVLAYFDKRAERVLKRNESKSGKYGYMKPPVHVCVCYAFWGTNAYWLGCYSFCRNIFFILTLSAL